MAKSKAEKNAYMREWNRKNPDKARNNELKKNHRITLEEYNAILAEQGGCCAVCGQRPGSVGSGNRSKGTLAVDHCHTTRTFRGLLCTNCNLGIGSFFEEPKLLENAAAYLKAHRELIVKIRAQKSKIQMSVEEELDRFLKS